MNIDRIERATSIRGLLAELSPEQIRLIVCTVTKTGPLELQGINDDKLKIRAGLIIIPQWMQTHTYDCSIPGVSATEITIRNGLERGDTLYVLEFCGGKKYYILDRM